MVQNLYAVSFVQINIETVNNIRFKIKEQRRVAVTVEFAQQAIKQRGFRLQYTN